MLWSSHPPLRPFAVLPTLSQLQLETGNKVSLLHAGAGALAYCHPTYSSYKCHESDICQRQPLQ